MRRVRVLLVEDNEVFREALELLLGLRADVEVVGAVGDGGAALAAALELRPDVVLMDYRLPAVDGIQATAKLLDEVPGIAVVALTASANEGEREALVAAGAVSCLTKDQELGEIVAAIRDAVSA